MINLNIFLLCLLLIPIPNLQETQKLKLPKEWKFIPMGNYVTNEGKDVSIQAFYLYETEISNKEYRAFLADLESKGQRDLLEICRVKNELWSDSSVGYNAFESVYFTNKAYDNFPVVNISNQAAMEYCKYLENTLNEKLKNTKVTVRLPLEIEWEYAASAGNALNTYAWEGNFLRNTKGEFLANYRAFKNKDENVTDLMAEVNAYFPNSFKLYNTCGNVSEMISENGIAKGGNWTSTAQEIAVRSRENYNGAAPTLGFRPLISYSSK
jgi:formylglycine-generating enzyme required for sulfatase activity